MPTTPLSDNAKQRIYVILSHLADCDDDFHHEERALLEKLRRQFKLSKQTTADLEARARDPKNLKIRSGSAEQSALKQGIIDMIVADDHVHAREQRLACKLAKALKIPPDELMSDIESALKRRQDQRAAVHKGEGVLDGVDEDSEQSLNGALGLALLATLAGGMVGKSQSPDALFSWIYAFLYGAGSFFPGLYIGMAAPKVRRLGLRTALRRARFGLLPGFFAGVLFGAWTSVEYIFETTPIFLSLWLGFWGLSVSAFFSLLAMDWKTSDDVDEATEDFAFYRDIRLFCLNVVPLLVGLFVILLIPGAVTRFFQADEPPEKTTQERRSAELLTRMRDKSPLVKMTAALEALKLEYEQERAVAVLKDLLQDQQPWPFSVIEGLERLGEKAEPALDLVFADLRRLMAQTPSDIKAGIELRVGIDSRLKVIASAKAKGSSERLQSLRRDFPDWASNINLTMASLKASDKASKPSSQDH